MNFEFTEEELYLMKWAISMMSTQLLHNVISAKQEMRGLSAEEKNALALLEQNNDNLPEEQLANLKELVKGKELKDNIADWQGKLRELKDLDKKLAQ